MKHCLKSILNAKEQLQQYRHILIRPVKNIDGIYTNEYFPKIYDNTIIKIMLSHEDYYSSLYTYTYYENSITVCNDSDFEQYFAYVTEYMHRNLSGVVLLRQTVMKLHDLHQKWFDEKDEFFGSKREIIQIAILYKDYEKYLEKYNAYWKNIKERKAKEFEELYEFDDYPSEQNIDDELDVHDLLIKNHPLHIGLMLHIISFDKLYASIIKFLEL